MTAASESADKPAAPLPLSRLVADLTLWARTESPTHSAEGVNAMIDLVAAAAGEQPVEVERIAGREGLGDNLLLRAGPRSQDPGILVLSHLDTVHPLGTMERDLPIRVEGDRLYGPGIFDMKGGAYLALQAFLDVARRGSARRPLAYLFTSDEEIGSPVSRPIIEDLGKRSAAVLVTEPARPGGRIVTARKGVGRFDIHVEGRPAHSGSRHQDGRSAIREAARQILAIEAMTDYGKGVTTTVGLISGGTAANVIPQHCHLSVDLRVTTAADGEDYAARIMSLKAEDPEVRLAITGAMNRPPYEKDAAVAGLFRRAAKIAETLGQTLADVPMTGGASDGNFTAALGIPTLDGLGVEGDGAHTLAEYALLPSIAPRMALMSALLEGL